MKAQNNKIETAGEGHGAEGAAPPPKEHRDNFVLVLFPPFHCSCFVLLLSLVVFVVFLAFAVFVVLAVPFVFAALVVRVVGTVLHLV